MIIVIKKYYLAFLFVLFLVASIYFYEILTIEIDRLMDVNVKGVIFGRPDWVRLKPCSMPAPRSLNASTARALRSRNWPGQASTTHRAADVSPCAQA